MTLREFFDLLAQHPAWILAYFLLLPLLAWLGGWLGRGEGHLPPWKYLYSALIYLACVPGIFSISLSLYMFLFERRSIMDIDLFTQVIPVLSMFITLWWIRRNVSFDYIPGFGRISGLIWTIAGLMAIMWFVDRTRIWMISFLPFQYVVLMLVACLLFIRLGARRIFSVQRN